VTAPLVPWSGGKTYRLPLIGELLDQVDCSELSYVDPMVGGGATFWEYGHRFRTRAIGDISLDLVALYRVVKFEPDALIELLTEPRFHYRSSKDALSVANYRAVQGSTPPNRLERAARTYFLLRTAINGLWRVNKAGKHNAAPGYKVGCDVVVLDSRRIKECHEALADTVVFRGDVLYVLGRMHGKKNIFLLIDPPYDSDDGKGFTGFSGEFGKTHQEQLVMALLESRHRFIYLNRATDSIRSLWAGSGLPHRIESLTHSVGPAAVRARVEEELIVWRL
jgi:DNA adenine methylase